MTHYLLRTLNLVCCPNRNLTIKYMLKKGEGLFVAGESFDNGSTNKSKFERCKSYKAYCYYRKLGHVFQVEREV